jgi:hypothetical protein
MSLCSIVCTGCGGKSFVIIDGTAAISATKRIVKVDNSVQQLKAEIAALVNKYDSITRVNDVIYRKVLIELRQLSAV